MKLYKKLTGLLIMIIVAIPLSAQNGDCNVNKSFAVRKGSALKLSNKFGDISFITGKNDSLKICTVITINQDDEILKNKNIKLININIENQKDTISISTQYDKKFFSESLREGRKSFTVDYIITLPVYMNVSVTDEFGNTSVEELEGILNVRLVQGNLNVKKLTRGNTKPLSSIYIDHGKADIDELNWITLAVYNCTSVNIDKAQAVMMTSVISKIKMGEISSIVANSKSDNYNIQSINNIIAECTYSEIEIGRLNSQLSSKNTYGSLSVADLGKNFNNMDISSNHAQISFTAGQKASFITDIIATDCQVEFPAAKFPGIIQTNNNYSTALLGIAGSDKQTRSSLKIRATGGKLKMQ
jgi:hypothetical protein